MSTRCNLDPQAALAAKPGTNFKPKWLSGWIVLGLLLVGLSSVLAEGPDARYLRIYSTIEKADSLAKSGQVEPAKAKYQAAKAELWDLKKMNPTWNAKAVAYRLEYLDDKIAALSQPAPTPVNEAAGGGESSPARAETQVKLLTPGVEPRQALRLHPKPGDKQTLAMTMKVAMDMQVGEAPGQPMKIPTMIMALEVTVKDVAANGDIAFETVMGETQVADEPGVLPLVVEAMRNALGGVKGLANLGTVSDRGLSQASGMKWPPGAEPQLRQSVDQMNESLSRASVPFPEQAIGPGAKWEVKQPLKSQGMTINQTATYELVSVDGDQLTVKSTLVQHAANQKIQSPVMPAMKVDVTKMTGSASGESKLDLGRLLPVLATIDAHSDISMSMNMGGQKQAMSMKSEMNIRLESK